LKKPGQTQRTGLSLRANFSWTFVGNVINAACWFGMTIVLAKLGSPEHVGQFALGLAIAVQATDANQEYQFGDYYALRLATTALALLVIVGIILVSGYDREMGLVVMAMAVSKALEAVSDAFYGMFMQHERMDRIAISLMLKGPLSLIGLGIGFYLTGSVFWAITGIIASRALILVIYDLRNASLSLGSSAKLTGRILPRDLPRPRWDAKTLGRLVWFTLPLGFVTMLISFNSNIPRYFIEGYLGAYQLGLFAAISSFQKVAPTVVQAMGRSASPRLAKYYAANNVKSFRKLTIRLVGIGILLGVAGVLVAVVLGRPILTLFYGPEYAMPMLFGLVMVASGLDYIATMLLFVITSARYFRIQLPLQIFTTGSVAVASFLMIPAIGLSGAAWALVIGNFIRTGGGFAAAWHAIRALRQNSVSSESDASAYNFET